MSLDSLIYVAGASAPEERATVSAYMRRLAAAGWTIALDWPAAIDRAGHANESLTDLARLEAALDCVRAVRRVDCLWLLLPEVPTVGAWVELGVAQALGISIVVSGPRPERSIMTALADFAFATHEEAFQMLTVEPRAAEVRA